MSMARNRHRNVIRLEEQTFGPSDDGQGMSDEDVQRVADDAGDDAAIRVADAPSPALGPARIQNVVGEAQEQNARHPELLESPRAPTPPAEAAPPPDIRREALRSIARGETGEGLSSAAHEAPRPERAPDASTIHMPTNEEARQSSLDKARDLDAAQTRRNRLGEILTVLAYGGRHNYVPGDPASHENEQRLLADRQRSAQELDQSEARAERQRAVADRVQQLREARDPASRTSQMRRASLVAIRDALAPTMPGIVQAYSDERLAGLSAQQIESDPLLQRLVQLGDRAMTQHRPGPVTDPNAAREDQQAFQMERDAARFAHDREMQEMRDAARHRHGSAGAAGPAQAAARDALHMTPEQQAVYDALPASQRSRYLVQLEGRAARAGNGDGTTLVHVEGHPVAAQDADNVEARQFRHDYAEAANGAAGLRAALAIARSAPGPNIVIDRQAAARLGAQMVPLRRMVAQLQGTGIINPGEMAGIERALGDPRQLEGMTFGTFGSSLGQFQDQLVAGIRAHAAALGVSDDDVDRLEHAIRSGGGAGHARPASNSAGQRYRVTFQGQTRSVPLTDDQVRALRSRGATVEGP